LKDREWPDRAIKWFEVAILDGFSQFGATSNIKALACLIFLVEKKFK
jgi:hypothetical protein